jgi:hypothetical protein
VHDEKWCRKSKEKILVEISVIKFPNRKLHTVVNKYRHRVVIGHEQNQIKLVLGWNILLENP